MKIGALAPWFGGKRTLTPDIVEELGKHRMYVEPFAGGVSVILRKPRASHEIVNDLHGDIINLARVVQCDDLGPKLFARALRTLPAEPLLHEAVDKIRAAGRLPIDAPADLERAYLYFVMCWLGRNGEAGLVKSERGRNIAMRFSANGGSAGVRFQGAADSIPWWWERLRSVMILRRDGFEVLADMKDEAGLVFYVDPPYVVKSDEYEHDFVSHGDDAGLLPDDHDRLVELLNRFRKVRIVVSYYDCQRVRELYRGWTFVKKTIAKNTSNVGGGEPTTAPEVLIINGPSLAGGGA